MITKSVDPCVGYLLSVHGADAIITTRQPSNQLVTRYRVIDAMKTAFEYCCPDIVTSNTRTLLSMDGVVVYEATR